MEDELDHLPEEEKASGGEVIDQVTRDAIRLAHDLLDRFPELVKRHKFLAGGAAISSSLVIIAAVAIAKRMRRGQTAQEAVADITEEELDTPKNDPRQKSTTVSFRSDVFVCCIMLPYYFPLLIRTPQVLTEEV